MQPPQGEKNSEGIKTEEGNRLHRHAFLFTSIGGGSMKSKDNRSFIPMALSDRIVLARFVR